MSPAGSIAFFGVVYAAQLYFEVAKNNKLTGLGTAILSLLAWDPSRVNKPDYVLALASSVLAHQFYVRYVAPKPFTVRISRRRRSHDGQRHERVQVEPLREATRDSAERCYTDRTETERCYTDRGDRLAYREARRLKRDRAI